MENLQLIMKQVNELLNLKEWDSFRYLFVLIHKTMIDFI